MTQMNADKDILFPELSGDIIGAAMLVLNTLKPGLDEKVYENALVIELKERGHDIDQQRRFDVYFKNQRVGLLIPDLIVDAKIIVDTKVVTAINEAHIAQMIGYLAVTGLELGLLLNFKHSRLTWKRVARSNPSASSA